MSTTVPVITIDGPSGSGKGTLSMLLATTLNWNYLDSGALYRLVGLAMLKAEVALTEVATIVAKIPHLNIQFQTVNHNKEPIILLNGVDVSITIRESAIANAASIVASYPEVRDALLEKQRAFRQEPGLVTDGRDMGTVIFPDARVKFYLIASVSERAQRRYAQLREKGIDVNLDTLLSEIQQRDDRDRHRAVSPLIPADDAIQIDTSGLSIQEVYRLVTYYVMEA